MAIYEIIIIVLWELFALWLSLGALYGAYMFWANLDARLAEAAASSIGLENAFTWEKAIKSSILLFLAGYMNFWSALALLETD